MALRPVVLLGGTTFWIGTLETVSHRVDAATGYGPPDSGAMCVSSPAVSNALSPGVHVIRLRYGNRNP